MDIPEPEVILYAGLRSGETISCNTLPPGPCAGSVSVDRGCPGGARHLCPSAPGHKIRAREPRPGPFPASRLRGDRPCHARPAVSGLRRGMRGLPYPRTVERGTESSRWKKMSCSADHPHVRRDADPDLLRPVCAAHPHLYHHLPRAVSTGRKNGRLGTVGVIRDSDHHDHGEPSYLPLGHDGPFRIDHDALGGHHDLHGHPTHPHPLSRRGAPLGTGTPTPMPSSTTP